MSPYNHLHAHAMLGPPDKTAAGNTFYRRNVIFWESELVEYRGSTCGNKGGELE